MRKHFWSIAISIAAIVVFLGCESRLTGNEGNLEFSYETVEQVRDFNKPIAVGAKLDVKVAEAGTRKRVELESAKTDDPEILAIDGFAGDTFILEGIGHGNTLVSVTARVPTGDVLPDSVNMMARVPEVLEILHTCDSGAEAHYLVDHEVVVRFVMKMSNGQPVIGYGYYPVDVEPETGVAINQTSKDQLYIHMHTSETPTTVTLSSQVDSTEATMVLIEKTQVDGVEIGPGDQGSARVGVEKLYHLLPTAAGRPVCQAVMNFTAESLTPEVCSVVVVGEPVGPNHANERGWIRVVPEAPGTCTFSATFPEGTDAVAELSIEVLEEE